MMGAGRGYISIKHPAKPWYVHTHTHTHTLSPCLTHTHTGFLHVFSGFETLGWLLWLFHAETWPCYDNGAVVLGFFFFPM